VCVECPENFVPAENLVEAGTGGTRGWRSGLSPSTRGTGEPLTQTSFERFGGRFELSGDFRGNFQKAGILPAGFLSLRRRKGTEHLSARSLVAPRGTTSRFSPCSRVLLIHTVCRNTSGSGDRVV